MTLHHEKWITDAWEATINKVNRTHKRIGSGFPHASIEGKYDCTLPDYWTSGFWPGLLWLLYRENKDQRFRLLAEQCEESLDEVLHGFYELDHDTGFMWLLTSVANYKLTGNENSKRRALTAASHLAGRFNVKGKYIRAWNNRSKGWAIIDCMMNIPILFWASELTEDPRFYHIAKAHAETTVKEFMHLDGSVHHIVSFDPVDGNCDGYEAGQGYSRDSAWSRGAAWALYGMSLTYKYTGDQIFVEAARKVANFFISHLPDDKVPFWDFKLPDYNNAPRDSSAGAIGASGLLELSNYVKEPERSKYITIAKQMIHSLYSNYGAWNDQEEGMILAASTNVPVNRNVEVPLIYGDYYFVECLSKLKGQEGWF